MARVQSSNGGGVNVRASKSTSASRLGTIPEGKQINVVTCDATWATLVYNGTPAFVQRQFIVGEADDYGAGLSENGRALCNANSVNVRSQPSASSATNGSRLNKGDSVVAYEYSYDGTYIWYRIGSNRWVRGDFLAPAEGYDGSSDGGQTGGSAHPYDAYSAYGPKTQVLRVGTAGSAVNNLQISLHGLGILQSTDGHPTSCIDGKFGTRTEEAVKLFQLANNLTVDGIVGNMTKEALWIKHGNEHKSSLTCV